VKPGGQKARRLARREAVYASRMAAAATARDAAGVALGQVRADIAKLPDESKDAAWKTVTRHLVNAHKEITTLFP
jgi:hypothetical protein